MEVRVFRTSWWQIIQLVVLTILTVISFDILCRWLAPTRQLREIEDAVAELRHSDPTVLVLGSSHARTFTLLGKALKRRTHGRQEMLAVPVEYGKLGSYEWVLQHRLRPLLEETNRQGGLRRSRLRHFILVTEWWDSTPVEGGGPAVNLPARAWGLWDFVRDVGQNGFTPYNQTYLHNRWMRLFRHSTLMQDRGHGRILSNLRQGLRPIPANVLQRRYQNKLHNWRGKIETGFQRMGHPAHMAAFDRILDYFQQRGIEVTVLLYPRMPGTLSPKGRRDTIDAFAALLRHTCDQRQIRLLDMTYTSPLQDADFEADFDHVTPNGNRKFIDWSLHGPLNFLLQDAVVSASPEAAQERAQ